jgi:hypothetical protein
MADDTPVEWAFLGNRAANIGLIDAVRLRPTTATSQWRTTVPFDPFRSRSAHVVELRPVTVHQAADDCSNESQDMHPRLPRHVPSALLLAPTLDDWREVVRP